MGEASDAAGGVLSTGLTQVEFGTCSAFWVGVFFLSSFVSFETILSECSAVAPRRSGRRRLSEGCALLVLRAGMPPVALAIDATAAVADKLPLAFSVLGVLAILYGTFKFRATLGKALLTVMRKVTKRR